MRRGRGKRRFTGVQDITPISQRPASVDDRLEPGHWEGDLIKGARGQSAVGTLVERTSRRVMLIKLDNAGAHTTLESFKRRLRTIPGALRKTLTYDRGTEMAYHLQLAKAVGMQIFFCNPYSPWQRGTNENTNGLVRRYLPKGMDLSELTQQQLCEIEELLNNRPRPILRYRTPNEVFAQLRAALADAAGAAQR